MPRPAIDLTGNRFGRLLVTHRADNDRHGARWAVRCDCGCTKIVAARALAVGDARSCGCLARDILRARTAKRFRPATSSRGDWFDHDDLVGHVGGD